MARDYYMMLSSVTGYDLSWASSGVSYFTVQAGSSSYVSEILPPARMSMEFVNRPVYRDRVKEVVVEKPIVKTVIQTEVIYMKWDLWNILVVALICAVTVKFILPRLTLRNIIKTAVKVVVYPFTRTTKKAIKDAEAVWKEEEAQDKA